MRDRQSFCAWQRTLKIKLSIAVMTHLLDTSRLRVGRSRDVSPSGASSGDELVLYCPPETKMPAEIPLLWDVTHQEYDLLREMIRLEMIPNRQYDNGQSMSSLQHEPYSLTLLRISPANSFYHPERRQYPGRVVITWSQALLARAWTGLQHLLPRAIGYAMRSGSVSGHLRAVVSTGRCTSSYLGKRRSEHSSDGCLISLELTLSDELEQRRKLETIVERRIHDCLALRRWNLVSFNSVNLGDDQICSPQLNSCAEEPLTAWWQRHIQERS